MMCNDKFYEGVSEAKADEILAKVMEVAETRK
jgi:NADH:ubiquinone oxidoreductase subunit E